MKPIRTSLIATGLALALCASAFAQMGPGHGTGPGATQAQPENMREHMRERMAQRHAKHLGELKTKLKLDASQETTWKTFADSMQPPAQRMHPDRAALAKLSTPERIDQMQAQHAQRDAEMRKRGEATKVFYAGLNTEQKKTFDAETARFMQGGMGMDGGMDKAQHRHMH